MTQAALDFSQQGRLATSRPYFSSDEVARARSVSDVRESETKNYWKGRLDSLSARLACGIDLLGGIFSQI